MAEKIILYHGSPHIVEEPQYGLGNPNNDYGLGFIERSFLSLQRFWAAI